MVYRPQIEDRDYCRIEPEHGPYMSDVEIAKEIVKDWGPTAADIAVTAKTGNPVFGKVAKKAAEIVLRDKKTDS